MFNRQQQHRHNNLVRSQLPSQLSQTSLVMINKSSDKSGTGVCEMCKRPYDVSSSGKLEQIGSKDSNGEKNSSGVDPAFQQSSLLSSTSSLTSQFINNNNNNNNNNTSSFLSDLIKKNQSSYQINRQKKLEKERNDHLEKHLDIEKNSRESIKVKL